MKILIVSISDIQGGASRAAYRLHESLLMHDDIESQILVKNRSSDDYLVISFNSKRERIIGKIRQNIDAYPIKFYKNRTKGLFSASFAPMSNIVNKINELSPDIVHLHWICDGMIKIEDLIKIKAPIVWSLHDMWAFTGGCHYDEECGSYINSCGNCKVLGSQKENDLSKKVFNRKEKTFSQLDNMTIVGLSNWINECSSKSSLLKGKRHVHLPNPIDTNIFKQVDRQMARELWNLPEDKKLILFGASSATSDPRKGFKELSESLIKLKNKNIEFVIFGSSKPENSLDLGFKIHYLGHLHDDISLVALYSAVDVMVVPSLQENLSNAIMESLSCSTPIVGFDIGGNSDMVEHQKNGYLAKPFDSTDLANGIEWILNNPNYDELCHNARDKVLEKFDNKIVGKRYIKLYKEILYEK